MPGDTAERLRRLQERRTRPGAPTSGSPRSQSLPPSVVPWPAPGDVVVPVRSPEVTRAAPPAPDRRRRRRKQPALITRALIAAASIGTFALLVSVMDREPATDTTNIDDATVPTTTAPAGGVPGRTGTTVLTVGDIGQMSATLHYRSAQGSPSATGR